jgi:hypothetical protein
LPNQGTAVERSAATKINQGGAAGYQKIAPVQIIFLIKQVEKSLSQW